VNDATSTTSDEPVVEAPDLDDPEPAGGETMTFPSTGTIDFPDGRHVRVVQADQGHRPVFYLTPPGEDERQVADDELHDLLAEAHELQDPAT
jgi:hypothetical protein